MKNFTAVPNQLLRTGLNLKANERLFLIYLMSHKKGYSVTDVQAWDNTGISRATIPKLRDKLRDMGYITYHQGNKAGWVYEVIIETLIHAEKDHSCLEENMNKETRDKIINAFKLGLQRFKESEHCENIIKKEYITGRWVTKETKITPGDISNVSTFIKKSNIECVQSIVDALENKLPDYLVNKIYDNEFYDYKTGKEITPTISFFLKSKSAYSELLEC